MPSTKWTNNNDGKAPLELAFIRDLTAESEDVRAAVLKARERLNRRAARDRQL